MAPTRNPRHPTLLLAPDDQGHVRKGQLPSVRAGPRGHPGQAAASSPSGHSGACPNPWVPASCCHGAACPDLLAQGRAHAGNSHARPRPTSMPVRGHSVKGFPLSPILTAALALRPLLDPVTPSAPSCRDHVRRSHTCQKIHVHPGPHLPTPLPSPPSCEGPTTLSGPAGLD